MAQTEQFLPEQLAAIDGDQAALAILALHGAGGTSDSWQKVRPIWEERGYHVETPDLPTDKRWGNFDKDARFAAKVMVGAGIKNWVVIGHSRTGNILVRLKHELDNLAQRRFVGRKAGGVAIKHIIHLATHVEEKTVGWISEEQKAAAPTKNTVLSHNPSRPASKRVLGVNIPYGRPIFGRGVYEFDPEISRFILFRHSSDSEASRGVGMLRAQRRGGKETIIENRPNHDIQRDYFVCAYDGMLTAEREIWIAREVLQIPEARIHVRPWDHTPQWAESSYQDLAADVLGIIEAEK